MGKYHSLHGQRTSQWSRSHPHTWPFPLSFSLWRHTLAARSSPKQTSGAGPLLSPGRCARVQPRALLTPSTGLPASVTGTPDTEFCSRLSPVEGWDFLVFDQYLSTLLDWAYCWRQARWRSMQTESPRVTTTACTPPLPYGWRMVTRTFMTLGLEYS